MKTMDGAHRPRIAWTVRAMFYYDDDINYLTAIIVPFIHMYTTITKFIAGMCCVRSTQAPSQAHALREGLRSCERGASSNTVDASRVRCSRAWLGARVVCAERSEYLFYFEPRWERILQQNPTQHHEIKSKMEYRGFDPRTSRMRSERSTN